MKQKNNNYILFVFTDLNNIYVYTWMYFLMLSNVENK